MFQDCNKLGLEVNFKGCNLRSSSFYGLKLKKAEFENCSLIEVQFTDCDLRETRFKGSDFTDAVLENCQLEKADFRETRNLIMIPERNQMKGAIFSPDGLAGLLQHHGIISR